MTRSPTAQSTSGGSGGRGGGPGSSSTLEKNCGLRNAAAAGLPDICRLVAGNAEKEDPSLDPTGHPQRTIGYPTLPPSAVGCASHAAKKIDMIPQGWPFSTR